MLKTLHLQAHDALHTSDIALCGMWYTISSFILSMFSTRTARFSPTRAVCTMVCTTDCLDPLFPAEVLYTDEALFTREGCSNIHNSHVWAHVNPRSTRPRAHQQRFGVNVWAGILGDRLIGPYILPFRLNGRTYRYFLEHVLPELLEDVSLNVRQRMYFQHDGAPAHFSIAVRNHLRATFGNRWIGRGGPVAWPPRSPDLTCLDFFLWGHMKQLVYETVVETEEDLVARITVAADAIADMPGIFERTRQSMVRRCTACIQANGRAFEQFL